MMKNIQRKLMTMILTLVMVAGLLPMMTLSAMAGAGDTWTSRSSGTGSILNGVCYGDTTFVAVGAGGTILTSSDGVTWDNRTTANSGTTGEEDLYRVSYGVCGGIDTFVAVGINGKIITSTNGGVNWTSVTSGTASNILEVCYGNGIFMAFPYADVTLISSDGFTWNSAGVPNSSIYAAIYAEGKFVAGGDVDYSIYGNVYTATSEDNGTSWVTRYNGTSTIDCFLNSICYDGANFVTVGQGGYILKSSDGVNWTEIEAAVEQGDGDYLYNFNGVSYGDNIFVVVGESLSVTEQGIIRTSTYDGTWDSDRPADHILNNVCFGNNTFVAVGLDGTILTSAGVVNTPPTFVGSTTTLSVNENAVATDIKDLLHVSDTDSSQTLLWSQSVAPNHGGTLSFTSATASSGSTNVTPGGTITYKPADGYDGTETFTIRVSDGTAVATREITVTVRPLPAAPVITGITQDLGASGTDGVTSDSTIIITGTAQASCTVEVFKNAISVGTTTSNASGDWTFDCSGTSLAENTYSLTAKATNTYGGIGSASAPFTVVIDSTAPGKPQITAISEDAGVSGTDGITNDNTLNVSGISEANSYVELFDGDNNSYGIDQADAGGHWSIAATFLPTSGSYSLAAVAKDIAGNEGNVSDAFALTIDKQVPEVTSVGVPYDGTYVAGQTLDFIVNFSENVTVSTSGGTPTLPLILNTGGTVNATYESGSETSALKFRYIVATGNADPNGITLGTAISLNSGTIKDAAGNDADLTLYSPASTTGVLVDAVAPTVSSINRLTPTNSLTNLTSVTYRVTFSEAVTGVDISDFSLTTTGMAAGTIASVSGASGTTIDVTVNTITGIGTLRLDLKSSGTGIADLGGTAIGPGFTSGQTYTIDSAAPTVASVGVPTNGTYKTGDALNFTVDFSEAVTVTGTPTLSLTIGTEAVEASYVSISSTDTALTFRYTVALGNVDSDGIEVGAAISLNSGTMKDAAGNDANLALISVGSTTAVLVDAIVPTVISVGVPDDGIYNAGDALEFTVNLSEAVTVTGTPSLAITLDTGGTVNATYVSGTGTSAFKFRYTVAAGNADPNGIVVGAAISLNSGTIKDAAGNDAILSLSGVPDTDGVLVDTVAPTVSSIYRLLPTGGLTNLTSVTYQITFSEAVTGVDASDFSLTTVSGSVSGSVSLVSSVSASVFDITVSSISGEGALRLNLKSSGTGIADLGGTAIGAGFTSGQTYTIDSVAPTVASVGVPTNATYKTGDALNFTVYFSEAVTITGAPSLSLTIGTGSVEAAYVSGTGTSALDFRYTVALGNVDSDGIAVGSLLLNSGAIKDTAGNDATLALPDSLPSTAGIKVDAIVPTVASVGVPDDGIYNAGDALEFTVNLSEAVTVTGTPSLAITLDTGGTVNATYVSGTGTSALKFRYTVAAGNADPNGIVVGAAISLNSGTIKDAAGNDATLSLSGVPDTDGVLVDTVAPTVSSINRLLPTGGLTNLASVTYRVTFSEAVAGVDISDFTLTATGTAAGTIASISGASGTAIDVTVNTITGTGTLRLDLKSSGTGIADVGGTAIGAGFTSGQTYTIDTVAPTISSVGVPTNDTYVAGDALNFTVYFSEAVTITGAPSLSLTIGTGSVEAAYISGTGTSALFRYTVISGNVDFDGIAISSLLLNSGTIKDTAGNDATLTLISVGSTTAVLVDAAAPTVASVTAPSNGTYATGRALEFRVNYSEAVTVTGTPSLSLTLNTGGTVNAAYISGSGTSALTFRYTVVSGNVDADGIAVGTTILLNSGTMKDAVGNDAILILDGIPSTAGVMVDAVAPTISSASVASDNTYMDIIFSKGVYGASGGTTPLSASKLSLSFLSNGGTATGASISSLTKTDGQALSGGETTVRVHLTVTGTIAGVETIEIKPASSSSVYDPFGNAMAVSETTGVKDLADRIAPTPGDSGTITVSAIALDGITLTWTGATDNLTAQSSLQYKVIYSRSNNIATVADAQTNGTLVQDWTADLISLRATGLPSSTTFHFNILVKDAAGNEAIYTSKAQATLEESNDSPAPPPPTTSGGAPVIVNGETQNAGTSSTSTQNGQSVTTVTVDNEKLQDILDEKGDNATVVIPVNTGSDVAASVLTGQMVKNMETAQVTLVVQTNTSTYTLPASQINIGMVSEQLGQQVSLSDIKVEVRIAEPPASTVRVVENAATTGEFSIVVPAVDFTISCTYDEQTVEVSSFNAYVERTIAIPDGVDPAKITTGIVVEPDGTVHHVPTRIIVVGGKYFAVINSLTNSTYTVIWHPVLFSDVAGHWAKDAINDMGSRMIVSGVGDNNYNPDSDITRAEFAAIIVRALGLEPGQGENTFSDVAAADWYCEYIKTAASYGIINGYSDTAFGPKDKITREQAMTMIARAMKITGLDPVLTDSEIASFLAGYTDAADTSGYAKTNIAACLKTGLVSGRGNSSIAPKDYITRAEVAAIVQRLLQKSELI